MGTTLILWSAPLVPDACAAEVLLRRWYKRGGDGEFEASEGPRARQRRPLPALQFRRGREDPAARAGDWIRSIAMAAAIVAATWLASTIPIGWIRRPLVALGAFFSIAALLIVGAMAAGALRLLDEKPCASPAP